MTALTMKQCREITDWIIDTTGKDGGQPVAIAICDGEGFLLSLVKMDEVPTKSVHYNCYFWFIWKWLFILIMPRRNWFEPIQ